MARVEGGVRDGSAEVRPQLHAVDRGAGGSGDGALQLTETTSLIHVDRRHLLAVNLQRRRAPPRIKLPVQHTGVDEIQRIAEARRDLTRRLWCVCGDEPFDLV